MSNKSSFRNMCIHACIHADRHTGIKQVVLIGIGLGIMYSTL